MGDKSKIQWTDATWNPIRGCSRVSKGCMNCYAESVANRFSGPGMPYEGLVTNGKWNGKIKFVENHIDDPCKWQKPRRIFVNSMSDLFHDNVDDSEIDQIFDVMRWSKTRFQRGHIFQILTKRPERMRDYMNRLYAEMRPEFHHELSHIWLGISVEDQETADARIPILLETQAAVRWVSYEPAIGPVEFRLDENGRHPDYDHGLDWIVVGGESGPDARPFELAWAISVVAECKSAGIACFVKQLGSNIDLELIKGVRPKDPKGGDMDAWPEDLRVREFPQ